MIDRHWSVVDIDVLTWRKIAPLLNPAQYVAAVRPDEHGLFILHDGARVLRAIDTTAGRCAELYSCDVRQPQRLARELHATGRWERVHIINKYHLEQVASSAQQPGQRTLSMDEYYHLVYTLIWDASAGYAVEPPPPGSWSHWTYSGLRELARQFDNTTLALVAVEAGRTELGLVVELRNGTLQTVTTLETLGFPAPVFAVSAAGFAALWSALAARNLRPGAVLLCSWEVCQMWLAAANKQAVLDAAAKQDAAFWRLEPVAAPQAPAANPAV